MPEGPSIVILKEELQAFNRKKVKHAEGSSTKVDIPGLQGKTIRELRSWGKHFLICFDGFFIRIHFLLFGSYRINERREAMKPRLQLITAAGEVNFYACSVIQVEGSPDDIYDWSGDVMNSAWDPDKARQKLAAKPNKLVCDALLDQDIFAGVGNIIKNEVLYRIFVHPLNKVGDLPADKLEALIREAVHYSFDFLKWKKAYVLKKHWLVHTKKTCPRCDLPVIKEYLGLTNRRTFFCNNCQVLYEEKKPKKIKK